MISERLVVVQFALRRDSRQLYVCVLIHHGLMMSYDSTISLLRSARQTKQVLAGKGEIPEDALGGSGYHTWLFFPYKFSWRKKKRPVKELAPAIRLYVELVALHTTPPPRCLSCEESKPLKLAIIEGEPLWLCDSCVEEFRQKRKQARQQYEQQRSRLGMGILVGLATSLIVGVVLFLLMLLMPYLPEGLQPLADSLLFSLVLPMVHWMMWRVTKITIWSHLVAMMLGAFGLWLGIFLFGLYFKSATAPITIEMLGHLALIVLYEPSFIFIIFLYILISTAMMSSYISDQKAYLASLANPEIEFIEETWSEKER
jgi:hypothetical protein